MKCAIIHALTPDQGLYIRGSLTVHAIPLLLVILLSKLLALFSLVPQLFGEVGTIQRASAPQSEPWAYAFKIEEVCWVAGQLDDKRVLILQERVVADRADLRRIEGRLGDTFKHCSYHGIGQSMSSTASMTLNIISSACLLSQNSSLTPSTSRGGVSAWLRSDSII